uniref:Uncharacterized protein n=1 Tax=Nymphaea colorata TaxID=210225 RepID=A0A5K1CZF9_9MAGN
MSHRPGERQRQGRDEARQLQEEKRKERDEEPSVKMKGRRTREREGARALRLRPQTGEGILEKGKRGEKEKVNRWRVGKGERRGRRSARQPTAKTTTEGGGKSAAEGEFRLASFE